MPTSKTMPYEYEDALAGAAYLIHTSNSLLALQLREFHAHGLVHGYWCTGAIDNATRAADIINIGNMAQRRRESLILRDPDNRQEYLDIAQRIDPVIVERPA